MRLFRQSQAGDWESVLARVSRELTRLFHSNELSCGSQLTGG
jgi:hypothetical protein